MPAGTMAGFGSASPFEPGGTLAGFETASRRCRPTVSRWRPSSRAIRRLDQPCADKVNIECCKFTLSSFIALKSSLRCPIRNASLKVAYFEVPIPGRFSLPADRWAELGMISTTNVMGRLYVTRQAINQFWTRADDGEFAKLPAGACKPGPKT